jgi:hypothetical protein
MTEEKGKAPEDTEQKSRRPGGPQPDPPDIKVETLNLPEAAAEASNPPPSSTRESYKCHSRGQEK